MGILRLRTDPTAAVSPSPNSSPKTLLDAHPGGPIRPILGNSPPVPATGYADSRHGHVGRSVIEPRTPDDMMSPRKRHRFDSPPLGIKQPQQDSISTEQDPISTGHGWRGFRAKTKKKSRDLCSCFPGSAIDPTVNCIALCCCCPLVVALRLLLLLLVGAPSALASRLHKRISVLRRRHHGRRRIKHFPSFTSTASSDDVFDMDPADRFVLQHSVIHFDADQLQKHFELSETDYLELPLPASAN